MCVFVAGLRGHLERWVLEYEKFMKVPVLRAKILQQIAVDFGINQPVIKNGSGTKPNEENRHTFYIDVSLIKTFRNVQKKEIFKFKARKRKY